MMTAKSAGWAFLKGIQQMGWSKRNKTKLTETKQTLLLLISAILRACPREEGELKQMLMFDSGMFRPFIEVVDIMRDILGVINYSRDDM